MNRIAKFAGVFALGLSILLAGCSSSTNSNNSNASHTEGHQQHAPNGDLQETTASLAKLPAFLDEQPELVRTAYMTAAKVTEQLDYIPCYCGCGESAGHNNNLNCFIKEINEDSVVWDDHGTRCGVCIETALITAKMHEDGASLTEIRAEIDKKYKEGYAKPTPTPMPSV
ncbi:PCYCGC domain-containing protein [Paenibacillus sp. SC116]|uniref:PCYCGC domain-containing protein n=1 Tax=Paenibacillus sp. SC116 TaxID=2968986 RepID=UPI00215B1374|nr:PCYCGC domain-containing protein [Paenibacillus sp. SC116]MCR8842627.1 PCYCGC domain-containing protein [Paenibacillus sp. SC116]